MKFLLLNSLFLSRGFKKTHPKMSSDKYLHSISPVVIITLIIEIFIEYLLNDRYASLFTVLMTAL